MLVSTAKITPTKLEVTALIKDLSSTSVENSGVGTLTLREVTRLSSPSRKRGSSQPPRPCRPWLPAFERVEEFRRHRFSRRPGERPGSISLLQNLPGPVRCCHCLKTPEYRSDGSRLSPGWSIC